MCQHDNGLFKANFKYSANNLSSNVNEPVRIRTKKIIDLTEKLQISANRRYSVYGINIANLMMKFNHSCP